ncbi:MAG: hypothetical protein GTO02_21985, partial [Candidatus Dadabacteria bacterium]|nr:hypothetical protein [Candidatus Dadabacteria bacterium]NIQ16956.1 hypothetical protein [Candidatus Dadabacteria bacterium]
ISFENGTFLKYITPDFPDGPCADGPCDDDVPFQFPFFIGLIGINNGDGTGSMDYWYGGPNIFRVENVGGDEA